MHWMGWRMEYHHLIAIETSEKKKERKTCKAHRRKRLCVVSLIRHFSRSMKVLGHLQGDVLIWFFQVVGNVDQGLCVDCFLVHMSWSKESKRDDLWVEILYKPRWKAVEKQGIIERKRKEGTQKAAVPPWRSTRYVCGQTLLQSNQWADCAE